jgi:hypothetical protein
MHSHKFEGEILRGRLRHKWVNNIKIDLKQMVSRCGEDSSGLGQELLESSCKHGNEPSDSIKGEEFLD